MRVTRQPLFLARQTYRRRRLMDAARLLPVLGVLLFLLPILWAPDAGPPAGGLAQDPVAGRATAYDGIYIMVAWAGLIVAAFVIGRGLAPDTELVVPPPPPAENGAKDGAGDGSG